MVPRGHQSQLGLLRDQVVGTWRLTDDQPVGVPVADSENALGPRGMQLTGFALTHLGLERVPVQPGNALSTILVRRR